MKHVVKKVLFHFCSQKAHFRYTEVSEIRV